MMFKNLLQRVGIVSDISLSKQNRSKHSVAIPDNYIKTLTFNQDFTKLIENHKFIARSDYKHFIASYDKLANFYESLLSEGIFDSYIKKYTLDKDAIWQFIDTYDDIKDIATGSKIIKAHNKKYVKAQIIAEKQYLDNVLKDCDPAIILDNEQREAIISDEDYSLVIAGAGAGKTTTVAAKVKYLVERKGIDSQKIIVISFTNKAVDELKERINETLKINCPITTFHSAGYSIVRKNNLERKQIANDGFLYNVVNQYLKSKVLKDEGKTSQLIQFFGSYFSAPYEGDELNEYFNFIAKADLSTLKSKVKEYTKQITNRRTNKSQTINNETVRSMEEVQIANFLYLNNIEYEYEPIYKYHILDANKPYTPDFVIKQGDKVTYIEHFGISESGHNSRYDEQTLERYKSRVNKKILLHRKHGTDLAFTYSLYNDGHSFLEHLKEQLIKRGYIFAPRLLREVYKKIIDTEGSKYIHRLTQLICSFISNFKTQGYQYEKFEAFSRNTKNVRTKLFLDICKNCYLEYQQSLEESQKVDFQDLINESSKIIREELITKEKLDFKYIIIDEYQDISRQRYNLIKELSDLCDAKIIAVGDDWQSIYAFSGSILPLFTQFCREFGYGQELYITRTYRNAQEIIDIAGTFIQRNNTQIQKQLISPKRIINPVIIYTYSEEFSKKVSGGRYTKLGESVNAAIEKIIEYNKKEQQNNVVSILLLGRYGFDARNLCSSKENFTYEERSGKIYSTKYSNKVKLQFLTAHSSKGLSAENVIIINARDETYGFPSKVDDDPVLNLVISNDKSYNYAEERRLFYVALTRTQNRVFIVTPEKRPSEFIKELLREKESYPNVTLLGELNASLDTSNGIKNICPICGYPMIQRWNKNYGLKLWICANDQEVCGFMTNNIEGGKLSIHKCDHCQDGFLIVKKNNNIMGMFLGCTNYKRDETGCSRGLSITQYQQWHNNDFGVEDKSQTKPCFLRKDNLATRNEFKLPVPVTSSAGSKNTKRSTYINTTESELLKIQEDGFEVVIDSNGKVITDIKLLKKLRRERIIMAKQKDSRPYMVARNRVLVDLATIRPTTKEEYMSIKNIGQQHYELYGKNFLKVIKKHIWNISYN